MRGGTGALRLGDVADVFVAGAPRRGSASFDGREAVVLSVQKVPGGNTPEITAQLDRVLASFGASVRTKGASVHANAYRQADFIGASIDGGERVVRDAVIVVLVVLVLTLFRVRTILTVLASMAVTMPIAVLLFPPLGLGINVMTLGGLAVAAGDIVDALSVLDGAWVSSGTAVVEFVRPERVRVKALVAASEAARLKDGVKVRCGEAVGVLQLGFGDSDGLMPVYVVFGQERLTEK